MTRGVRGIRLKPKDQVDACLVVDDQKLLLIAGQNGLGIRTRFSAFLPNGGKLDSDSLEDATPRKRGGQGVTAMNTERIIGALSVDPESEILMITSNGQAVRCPVNNVRETSRGSKGVKLVNLSGKDKLTAISEVIELDEGDEIEEEGTESENSLENESGTDKVNPNTDPDTETDSSE